MFFSISFICMAFFACMCICIVCLHAALEQVIWSPGSGLEIVASHCVGADKSGSSARAASALTTKSSVCLSVALSLCLSLSLSSTYIEINGRDKPSTLNFS